MSLQDIYKPPPLSPQLIKTIPKMHTQTIRPYRRTKINPCTIEDSSNYLLEKKGKLQIVLAYNSNIFLSFVRKLKLKIEELVGRSGKRVSFQGSSLLSEINPYGALQKRLGLLLLL